MKIFQFIKNIFSGNNSKIINIYLQCNDCDDKLKIVLRKGYDISRIYKKSDKGDYQVKKVAICNDCYSKIPLLIKFNNNYEIIDQEINNGKMITKEEYYRE